jgi:hypothetical protein
VGPPFPEETNDQFTPKLDEIYMPESLTTAVWYCPVDDMEILYQFATIGAPFTEGTNDQVLPKFDEIYKPPPITHAV